MQIENWPMPTLKIDQFEKALEHALAEYNRRPKNIDVNETVAWVYHQKRRESKSIALSKRSAKNKQQKPGITLQGRLDLPG